MIKRNMHNVARNLFCMSAVPPGHGWLHGVESSKDSVPSGVSDAEETDIAPPNVKRDDYSGPPE